MLNELLKREKLILASSSIRRMQIFKMLGLKFLQVSPQNEVKVICKNPSKYVQLKAKAKAKEIAATMSSDCFIVAADTIVYKDEKIIEKPKNIEEAGAILFELSDSLHYVYTGINIIYKNFSLTTYEKTAVRFKLLTNEEINFYVNTKEPYDKAGAYAIQGIGSQFIEKNFRLLL